MAWKYGIEFHRMKRYGRLSKGSFQVGKFAVVELASVGRARKTWQNTGSGDIGIDPWHNLNHVKLMGI